MFTVGFIVGCIATNLVLGLMFLIGIWMKKKVVEYEEE